MCVYDYGLRFYYLPKHRFLTRDPIEEQGGLNLYAFCGNDPVNNWDYLGMWTLVFRSGFTETEKEEKKIFNELPEIVSKAKTRLIEWQNALPFITECDCKAKSKMQDEIKYALKILNQMEADLKSEKRLLLKPKYLQDNDGLPAAGAVPSFAGYATRNKIYLSTNPDANDGLRPSSGVNWGEVTTTIFHELSHIAGIGDESRWKYGKSLYFSHAHNFHGLSSNPEKYDMFKVYYYWNQILKETTKHYLKWKEGLLKQIQINPTTTNSD